MYPSIPQFLDAPKMDDSTPTATTFAGRYDVGHPQIQVGLISKKKHIQGGAPLLIAWFITCMNQFDIS